MVHLNETKRNSNLKTFPFQINSIYCQECYSNLEKIKKQRKN